MDQVDAGLALVGLLRATGHDGCVFFVLSITELCSICDGILPTISKTCRCWTKIREAR